MPDCGKRANKIESSLRFWAYPVAIQRNDENDAGTQSWSGSVSAWTDSVFVGQCLSVVHCPPAFPNSVEKKSSRSFTSVQMFHTHPFSQEYLILISLSQSHRIHVWYLGHVDFHHLHRTKHGRSGRARAGHGISRSLWRWMHSTVHVRYMGMGQNLLLPYWGNKHSLTNYWYLWHQGFEA